MMKLKETNVQGLIEAKGKHLLSIYITTHRASHNEEDRIRFKNALSEAEEKLEHQKIDPDIIKKTLRPGKELLDNESFWLHQSDGLCAFSDGTNFQYYKIPYSPPTIVHVGERYITFPLVEVMDRKKRFFILNLSMKQIDFYEGNAYSITDIKIEDVVPKNKDEIMKLYIKEKSLQHHSSPSAIYHGQGGGEENEKAYTEEYLRQIDKGLMTFMHDERCPLILAGVDHITSMYQKISKYNHVMEETISGNHEHTEPTLLHEKAWSIMDHAQNSGEKLKEKYGYSKSKRMTDEDQKSIYNNSLNGRVSDLIVPINQVNQALKNNSYDANEVNETIIAAYHNGSEIHFIDQELNTSDSHPIFKAILRY